MTAVQILTQQNLQSVLSFDGKDDYIDLAKKSVFNVSKNLTLSAWINVNSNREWAAIISKIFDTGSTESGYGILLDGKSGVYFGLKVPSKGIQYLSSGANTVKLNQWHHIACTYDGQTIKIYIDGVEKASQNLPDSKIDYEPENNLYIGMYKDDNEAYHYTGKIAEVCVWDKVCTLEEIKQNMNHRLTGKEAGLIGYWPLNGNASDQTANNNSGAINGANWTQENLEFLQPLKANVEIAEIVYKGHVKRTQSDEYIEIRNSGNGAADLSNWKVTSSGKEQIFAFPEGTSLAAGQIIRVYTNEVHQESGGFSFGSKTAIWNDKGDMGKVLDSEGNEVSSFSYDNN
ncbi:LamG-like jellyroll fold domain-containing protein [Crocosphaera sp. UHCC 0190]|uniref:LamG-like jellyroll fold domain-containing protein n=1 Tax=Crocosphaera sp. UHCC 0190 TaxID=3110246 RepID=UPI002B1F905F|nr:LamG-like jellyroll fold domain-containing protein [Crocosphaera sp. UHCC 0190]MEA5510228.1 LamG-like jellyroll fold domain-containing protein [Crocosphaera sp. UHCC 0190]